MNPQLEFMDEAFHALAQPVTAMHAALELGLANEEHQPAAQKIFEDCLSLLDRLMQDLAVFREIASLDEAPPLAFCDAQALLQSCVEEMAPVAQACGVELQLSATRAEMPCHAPTLQRAMFILLDEMIACAPTGGCISIRLSRGENGLELELRPGAPSGHRQQLCRKLIEFAGGSGIQFESKRTFSTFREGESRQFSGEDAAIRKF